MNGSFRLMKLKTEHIVRYIQQREEWLLGVPLVLTAFIELQSSGGGGWTGFIYFLIIAGVPFLPVLLFKWFQSQIKNRWSGVFYLSFYGFLFLIYPLLLIWASQTWFDHRGLSDGFFAIAGAGMLSVEGLLRLNQFIRSNFNRSSHGLNLKIGFETSILLILAIISFIVAIMAVSSLPETTPGSELVIELKFSPQVVFDHLFLFVGYAVQFFLWFLCWYAFYYVNHYGLYRGILLKKGVLLYLLTLSAVIVLMYPVVSQFILWLPLTERIPDLLPSGNDHPFALLNGLIGSLVITATFPLILIRQWYQKNVRITMLEQQKAEAELALLKQQINPHFFLNTLNNLYALSLNESDQTPEMIMKLSELMRYVLYRGNKDKVKLEDEITYIEDYLKLQKMRVHQSLDLTFKKEITEPALEIPPLLLIVFVENAFKHGIEPDDEAGYIRLNLKAGGNQLQFVCENSVPEPVEDKEAGIGLENLGRRLELQFPDSHDLQIMQNPGSFKAELNIQFDDDS